MFIVCLTASVRTSAVLAADWPTYRADITRSGASAERLPHALVRHWSYRPHRAPKPAWPPPAEELPRMHSDNAFDVAIAQGVAYFGSSVTDQVWAVDAASGQVRWTYCTEGPVRFAPTVSDGRVYFGSDDGHVYCLDAAVGTLVWKRRAGPSDERVLGNGRMISLWPVRTSVLVDAGLVHFAAGVFPYEGLYVYALRAEDGALVWVNDTIGDRAHELEFGGISPHGYLVASDHILYVPSGRAMPAAFDRATGKFLFQASPGGKRGGTWALLDDNRLIAGVEASGAPNKAVYDATSGVRQEDAFAWFAGTDMAVTPTCVFLVSADGLYAVDRTAYAAAVAESKTLDATRQTVQKELDELKQAQAAGTPGVNPEDRTTQIAQHTQQLEQVTAQRAKLRDSAYRWRRRASDLVSVVHVGDLLVAGGQNVVVAFEAATGTEVWRHAVDGRAVGLAAADGCLVVSTDTGCVDCFAKEETDTATSAAVTIRDEAMAGTVPSDADVALYREAAQRIIADTGITKGYALVLDCGEGRLAAELAQQSELQVIGLERDETLRAAARSRLTRAGLWGSRVVVEPWDLATLPDYFANLIVSDGMLLTGQTASTPDERMRVLRPWGGVAVLGARSGSDIAWQRSTRGPLEGAGSWTQQFADPHNTACSGDTLVRGPLGILWYGEPGPQGMVERHAAAQAPVALDGRLFIQGENLIRAIDAFNGTRLWEREIPGAVRVLVKADSGNLVATPTGLYVAAFDSCHRLDPATGETLRVYQLPPGGAAERRRWGHLSVVGNALYGSAATAMQSEYGAIVAAFMQDGRWRELADVPTELRADYEQVKRRFPDPAGLALAAQREGFMFGRMTNFPGGGEFTQKNATTPQMMTSDRLFAIDTETGELLWQYFAPQIANVTIVPGQGQLFLAHGNVSTEQRHAALVQRRRLIDGGLYRLRPAAVEELAEQKRRHAEYLQQRQTLVEQQRDHRQVDNLLSQVEYVIDSLESELFKEEHEAGRLTYDDADVRVVVALDAATGTPQWEQIVDLTGCGGDYMGAAYADGRLLFFGNHGNHDAWRFRAGGMKWRRITVLAAASGDLVWSRPLNYRTRPVIVGDRIILEPQACDLHTGEILTREHPVTGALVPWEFLRPGHTCGLTAASATGLFYRSACTAFYDLARDSGVTIFGAYRPGCAISVIPACGVLMSPEASAGCTCSYPIRCTWVMKHKAARPQPWGVYVTPGDLMPVKHLALNLGAVADMTDDDGTVWFAYPSPNTASHTHFPNYGVKFALHEEISPGMGYFAQDFRGVSIAGTHKPWLFTSGCRGLMRCTIPLMDADAGQAASNYRVRLGFRAPQGDRPGQRVFDIKLQGEVVQAGCDIAQLAGGVDRAVVLEFDGIAVEGALALELRPATTPVTDATAPILNCIEISRSP